MGVAFLALGAVAAAPASGRDNNRISLRGQRMHPVRSGLNGQILVMRSCLTKDELLSHNVHVPRGISLCSQNFRYWVTSTEL